MLRKVYLVPAVMSLACLLAVADSAHAQRRGGGGRGWGGGGWNNSRYYGGYGGYGGNYYGRGFYGPGIGIGIGYGGYGYGRGGYGYGSPYYSGYSSGYSYPSDSFYYTPSADYASGSYTQSQPRNAQIRVIVPDPNARVLFDGNATQQTGTERWFYTPDLQAGANNTYRIRASWMQGGREVTQERVVNVNPGQMVTVEFNQSSGGTAPPDPLPLPGKTTVTTLDGRVIRTGPDHFVIQSTNQGEITIYTNPQTRYMLNQNPGAFTDIRTGTNVNFGFTMQGDRRIANTVTIRP